MISKTLMAASTKPIILSILSRDEDYGYSIIQKVKNASGGGLEWTDGMLYPVLQRMEMDGLITSKWRAANDVTRPRRYFQITPKGREALAFEIVSWRHILQTMIRFSESRPAET